MRAVTSSFLAVLLALGCNGPGSSSRQGSTVAPVNTNPGGTGNPTSQTTTAPPVSASLTLNHFTVFREQSSIADLQAPSSTVLANRVFALQDKGFVRVLDVTGPKPILDREIPLDVATPFAAGVAAGSLTISDDQTALVAVSGKEAVYIFDPGKAMTANDVTKIDLSTMTVSLTGTPTNSVGKPVASPMPLTYTASAIVSKGKIFIASSNLDASFNYNPGTVIAFDYNAATRTIANGVLIVTSAFDPTRLTRWRSAAGDELILCVNAGVAGKQPSSIDVIDPVRTALVATIPLAAGSATGAVAITPDTTRGYVGSQSAAELYELDLSGIQSLLTTPTVQTLASKFVGPIAIPSTAALNFIAGVGVAASGKYVYATNFNTSSLAVVDVAARKVVGTLAGFQRQGDPAKFQCNASALAVRPGAPGTSFTGPAVYVATVSLDAADRTIPNVNVALDGVSFDRN